MSYGLRVKKKINYKLCAMCFLALLVTNFLLPVTVSSQAVDFDENVGIDESIDLQQIRIPFFPQLAIDTEYSTTLSWITFALNLGLLAVVVFWIFKIVLTGVQAMKKATNPEGLQEALKKVRSVLEAAGLTFIFPILLIVVGALFGLGPVWNWPLAFRECNTVIDGREVDYYFQAFALVESKEEADSVCFIQ